MSDKIRILYIDDNELDRELVKDVLEKEYGGFEVAEASGKQEFDALLKMCEFDIVLSDFNIAGFEGLQVLEAVRAYDPRIPVIIVTGTGSEEIAAQAIKQGASDYVIKRPKHIQKLPQTIFSVIEKKKLIYERELASAEIKKNNLLLQRIIRSPANMNIVSLDKEYRYLFFNEGHREAMKNAWEADIEIGESLLNYIAAKEDRIVAKDYFDRALKGESFSEIQEYGEDERLYRESMYSPILDQDENINGLSVFSIDVTKRKKAETALEESEAKYRELVQNANSIIFRFDIQGRLTFINEFAQQFFGYSEKEILGRKITETIVSKTESSGRDLEKMIEAIIRDPEQFVSDDNVGIKRNGEKAWIAWRNKAILDKNGDTTEILSVGIDITKRKEAEEARIRLETAINSVVECVMITDADGVIEYVNSAFERITGYTRQEAIGQNPRFLKSGKHYESFYKSMWTTLKKGSVWKGHIINKKKDDDLYEIDATISPMMDASGKIINYVAVRRDVTDEIKREKQFRQAQKMEAIGTLAGGIAHDFNNILSSVIGYSELALERAQKGTQLHDNITEVLNAGIRAKDLVKQILAFSRQAEQEFQPVQIKLIVKEALKLLRASLPVTIEIRQNIQSKKLVLADPTQIHQILMNLCTNAGHAMREKGGTLEVSLGEVELDRTFTAQNPEIQPGVYQIIAVSDTGHGISANELENIFDPFYTTKQPDEGTGMGLAVVHGIVKSHGGTVKVYSEPGKGSTFKIYLPIIETKTEPEVTAEEVLPKGSEHILYVDDEKPLVDIGKHIGCGSFVTI